MTAYSPCKRLVVLLTWLQAQEFAQSTAATAELSVAYAPRRSGRERLAHERCFDDLRSLERKGLVQGLYMRGMPMRWRAR